jgi:hypothetical protein
MYLQKYYLKKDEVVVSAKTEPIPLPVHHPILGLLIHYNFATGAGEAVAAVNEVIVEILKNGAEVITSAQMGELIAYAQMTGYRNYPVADLGASVTGEYLIPVLFGRHFLDLDYWLDPRLAKIETLDLKLTQPTHTATTTYTYDVILLRLMEPTISSHGYFKISTKREYPASAAIEYVTLDRAYPYGALLVSEMDGTSTDIATIISNAKLNINAGEFTPIDEAGEDIELQNILVRDGDRVAVLPNVLVETNFLALDFMHPWLGEGMFLQAPKYGSVVLELTGSAAGAIRVTGAELVT